MNDLQIGTKYYVKAYATNIKGTSYGKEITLTHNSAEGFVYDIDSNKYKTIIVGDFEWLAENLKTTKLNDGTPIKMISDNKEWENAEVAGYCWYDNDVKNKDIYGAIYNWKTVKSEKLCPKGWSVPSDSLWNIMTDSLIGGKNDGGNLMKATGIEYWKKNNKDTIANQDASNKIGFSALPGGLRERDGKYYVKGENAFWWSASAHNETNAMYYYIENTSSSITQSHIVRTTGLNVRCIKNRQ